MVCPIHKTILHNSTVLVRGHNPQAYVPADVITVLLMNYFT